MALVCAVGVVGILSLVLPGTLLIGGAILVWGIVEGTPAAWITTALSLLVLAAGMLLKYLIPGRWLTEAGVPTFTLIIGGVVGIIGFFVIPVVGVIVGFIAGIFAWELLRIRALSPAWSATWAAMKASGLSLLIELGCGLVAIAIWAAGVFAF